MTQELCIENPPGWTHAICAACNAEQEPENKPVEAGGLDSETCCYCGEQTFDRIFYRRDPKDVHPKKRKRNELFVDIELNVSLPPQVEVTDDAGTVVWKGTTTAFGFMIAALRSDLIREWRCWREDGSYGPPCQSHTRDEHQWRDRHETCTWIVYYEQKDGLF